VADLGNSQLVSRASRSAASRSTHSTKRKRIFVLGNSSNDFAKFASQQLDTKCYSQFDIICYSIPCSATEERESVYAFGHMDRPEDGFIDQHYDILISIGLDVIQLLPKIPSYEKILFWDVESTRDEYDAIIENVNFFISRYLY
jgi:hypothetical protein